MEYLQRVALIGDRSRNKHLAGEARSRLIQASHATELVAERAAAFAWMLHGGTPEQAQGYYTLWIYKWVANSMIRQADVSLERVHAVIDDLEERFRSAGMGEGAAWQLRLAAALETGQAHSAEELYRKWMECDEGSGSDCKACRIDMMVDYWLARGDLGRAMEEAEPLLSKQESCDTVPHRTCSVLIMPLLCAGQEDRAREVHRQGLRLLRSKEGMTGSVARHAQYLALAGSWSKALKLIETRLERGWGSRDTVMALECELALWLVCLSALERGRRTLSARFPKTYGSRPDDGLWDLTELCGEARSRSLAHVHRLDTRNGTALWRDRVAMLVDRIGGGLD